MLFLLFGYYLFELISQDSETDSKSLTVLLMLFVIFVNGRLLWFGHIIKNYL